MSARTAMRICATYQLLICGAPTAKPETYANALPLSDFESAASVGLAIALPRKHALAEPASTWD
jgi:hypothetical protein